MSMRSEESMDRPIKSLRVKIQRLISGTFFLFSASKIKVFVHIILLYNYYVFINTHIHVYI